MAIKPNAHTNSCILVNLLPIEEINININILPDEAFGFSRSPPLLNIFSEKVPGFKKSITTESATTISDNKIDVFSARGPNTKEPVAPSHAIKIPYKERAPIILTCSPDRNGIMAQQNK